MLSTFICALAPEASKGLGCYSLLCFVCIRIVDEKGLVTNGRAVPAEHLGMNEYETGCHLESVLFRFAGLGIFCLSC